MNDQFHQNLPSVRISVVNLTEMMINSILPEYLKQLASLDFVLKKQYIQYDLNSILNRIGLAVIDGYLSKKRYVMFERIIIHLSSSFEINFSAFNLIGIDVHEVNVAIKGFVSLCENLYRNRIFVRDTSFSDVVHQIGNGEDVGIAVAVANRPTKTTKSSRMRIKERYPILYDEMFV